MIASKFKTLIRLLRQLERVPVLEDQVAVLRRESSSVAGEVQKLGVVEQEMRDALIGSSERVEKSLENLVNWLRDDMASEQRKLSDARVEQSLSDLKRLLSVASFPPPRVILKTDHPIAVDSDDHRFPRGTLHDDTRWPRFCAAAESIFPGRKIRFLDIGCAGGGSNFCAAGWECWATETRGHAIKRVARDVVACAEEEKETRRMRPGEDDHGSFHAGRSCIHAGSSALHHVAGAIVADAKQPARRYSISSLRRTQSRS